MGKMSVGLISGFVGFNMALCTCNEAITDHMSKNYTKKLKETVRDSFELSAADYNKLENRLEAPIKDTSNLFKSIENTISWQEALDSLKNKKAYQDGFNAAVDSIKKAGKRIR